MSDTITKTTSPSETTVQELSGAQRTYLKGRAHDLSPLVQIGDKGLTEGVVEATAAALQQHELIKVRMRQPDDKKGIAKALAEQTLSALCGLVGHTAILYKAHPEHPQLRIPKR